MSHDPRDTAGRHHDMTVPMTARLDVQLHDTGYSPTGQRVLRPAGVKSAISERAEGPACRDRGSFTTKVPPTTDTRCIGRRGPGR